MGWGGAGGAGGGSGAGSRQLWSEDQAERPGGSVYAKPSTQLRVNSAPIVS